MSSDDQCGSETHRMSAPMTGIVRKRADWQRRAANSPALPGPVTLRRLLVPRASHRDIKFVMEESR